MLVAHDYTVLKMASPPSAAKAGSFLQHLAAYQTGLSHGKKF
jgi:hypothetical protein